MSIRKGDLVKIKKGYCPHFDKTAWHMVTEEEGKFPTVKGTIEVEGDHIVSIDKILDVFSRDGVKEYWKYI